MTLRSWLVDIDGSGSKGPDGPLWANRRAPPREVSAAGVFTECRSTFPDSLCLSPL